VSAATSPAWSARNGRSRASIAYAVIRRWRLSGDMEN
jgi:hypothetical protein